MESSLRTVDQSLSVIEHFTHLIVSSKTSKQAKPKVNELLKALRCIEKAYTDKSRSEQWQTDSAMKITNMMKLLKTATDVDEAQLLLGPLCQSIRATADRVVSIVYPFEKKGTRVGRVDHERLSRH